MRRGVAKASKAKKISDLPQEIRLEFDRGRVNLAASLEEFRKSGELHRDLLLALALMLERAVGNGMALEQAGCDWEDVHTRIEASARKANRRKVIIATILILFIVGLITLGVLAS